MSFLFPSSTITLDAALRDLAQGSPKARTAAAQALGDVSIRPRSGARSMRCSARSTTTGRRSGPRPARRSASSATARRSRRWCVRLDDGIAAVRQNAAIALGSLRHADGFAPLADALRDGPADLRFQAATSLAEIDPARAFDPLMAALDDTDPQVVAAAALSLGAIGDPRAVPRLVAALERSEMGGGDPAGSAGGAGGKAPRGIDHRAPATRFDAAYALAELGDPRGRDVLNAALSDAERAWDAVTALARLATPDDAEVLGRALLGKHVPPEATVLAAGAILKIAPASAHGDAARRVLLAALAARKVHVRGIAVEQLGEVGGAWATAPLERLARSGKGAELLESIAMALRAIEARTAGLAPAERGAGSAGGGSPC